MAGLHRTALGSLTFGRLPSRITCLLLGTRLSTVQSRMSPRSPARESGCRLASVTSLILIWRRGRREGRCEAPSSVEGKPVLWQAGEGFRLVVADRVLAATATTVVISVGCLAMMNSVFMYFLVHAVRLSSVQIGVVFVVGEGGGLVTALWSGRTLRRVGTARIMWVVVLADPAGLLAATADHADAVVLGA